MEVIMKIFNRKQVELQFVDVKVSLKVNLAALTTDILFDSSDDADKVFEVLNHQETIDGCYNIVDKVSSKIIRLTGEIVVKFLHTNTLVVTVYKNWEEL